MKLAIARAIAVTVVPCTSAQSVYIPITPCRVVDTRFTDPLGLGAPALMSRAPRTFPILSSPCIPPATTFAAYVFNVTVVPTGASFPQLSLNSDNGILFLTIWPTGVPMPIASTLNDWYGTVVANSAIIPAGTLGNVDVYSTQPTDLILDLTGFFTPMTGYTFGSGLSTVTTPGSPVTVAVDGNIPRKFILPTAPVSGVTGARMGDMAFDTSNANKPYLCMLAKCDTGGFQPLAVGP